jgi:hypothetical protein
MLLAAALTALLLFPAAATAKGPSAATISGPGLAHALTIDGYGEGDSTSPLGILVTETGFFPQAFHRLHNDDHVRQTDQPRYDVKHTVPEDRTAIPRFARRCIPRRQRARELHDFGQSSLGHTVPGGWYRGTDTLKHARQGRLPVGRPRRHAGGRTVAVAAPVSHWQQSL